MPIIKSAKAKLKKDKKKTKSNIAYKLNIQKTVAALKKSAGRQTWNSLMQKAFSKIDKAAKRNVIHKNKARRLKSRISKITRKK
ncbi:30S ribosomal protein S20 [Candidatus Roizmanbacteria bacterium]|nr:30S ribosomal protein S20 [Candidatus Roizmanbacteria bacterium]